MDVGLTGKESRTHSNKVVTKIKVPEVVICFDDGACEIVKDICIDEGLQPLEKILLENSEFNEKTSAFLKSNVKHANDDLDGEDNGAVLITEDMKSPLNFEKDSDSSKSWSSFGSEEKSTAVDEPMSKISEKEASSSKLLPAVKANHDSHHTDRGKSEKDAPLVAASSGTNWTSFTVDSDSNNNTPSKDEVTTGATMAFLAADSGQASGMVETPINLTTEEHSAPAVLQSEPVVAGKNIRDSHVTNEMKNGTNDSNRISEYTTTRSSDASRSDIDSEPLLKTHNPSVSEETAAPDDTTTTVISSLHNNNQEEINFSGPSYMSGPKVPSAHIAFSGDISHRSDSTTSIRSFAFPVLQTEWNTSPVRMAKANRRRFRKNRCWGIGLCGKF